MTYQYFKFRVINKYLLESLMQGALYFASPEELNDPFDCNLDIKKAIINFEPSEIVSLVRDLYQLSDENKIYLNACYAEDGATFRRYRQIIYKCL